MACPWTFILFSFFLSILDWIYKILIIIIIIVLILIGFGIIFLKKNCLSSNIIKYWASFFGWILAWTFRSITEFAIATTYSIILLSLILIFILLTLQFWKSILNYFEQLLYYLPFSFILWYFLMIFNVFV